MFISLCIPENYRTFATAEFGKNIVNSCDSVDF